MQDHSQRRLQVASTWFMIRFALARMLAHLTRILLHVFGRAGTTLPGRVLVTIAPDALVRLRSAVTGTVVCISATNGKTTTATVLAGILQEDGRTVLHNASGANLRSGIVTTLMDRSVRSADIILLEIDEATLSQLAADLKPDVVMLGNLFRDQLDRFGELDTLALRWQTMIESSSADMHVVLNADDPLLAAIAADRTEHVTSFGIDDPSVALDRLPHAADSTTCPRCASPLQYQYVWLGHLGVWACPACGAHRPDLDVRASKITSSGLAGSTVVINLPNTQHIELRLRVPGLYNVYNALSAVATAHVLGVSAESMTKGVERFAAAFGRFERVPVPGGGTLTMLLVKNPTGLNEIVRTLVASGVDLRATMIALNDGIADGRDVSWIWDADIEPLIERAPDLIVSGSRAAEMAIRIVHAGAHPDALHVSSDVEDAMFTTLDRAQEWTEHHHAYALLTYTAMLELREVISRKGWTAPYWEQSRTTTATIAGSGGKS